MYYLLYPFTIIFLTAASAIILLTVARALSLA